MQADLEIIVFCERNKYCFSPSSSFVVSNMPHLMSISLLFVLVSFVFIPMARSCDVYKRTMESIQYWHSYDFSQGMDDAIRVWYAPDAKVTMGMLTASPQDFFGASSSLELVKLDIHVKDIDCAAEEWCHLHVFTTYHHRSGETVSMPQYWTYLYDPVTCLWAHYIILAHSNDMEHMMDVLSPRENEL